MAEDTRTDGNSDEDADDTPRFDAAQFLDEVGFDEESSLLTRRQATVLALREHGFKQATIAERLGTSRANVSGIEASARTNIEQARETVTFSRLLSAPVRVEIPAGVDLYDVPDRVFTACDEAGLKVTYNAPDLMKLVSDAADDAIDGRQVRERLFVNVTTDGEIEVRNP